MFMSVAFDSETTEPLRGNATAAEVEGALEALASIGAGNVSVTGDAGGPWNIEFVGSLGLQTVGLLNPAIGDNPRTTVNYVYSYGGPLASIVAEQSATYTIEFDHDRLTRPTQIRRYAGGLETVPVVTDYAYDALNRATSIAHSYAVFGVEVDTEGQTGVNEVQTIAATGTATGWDVFTLTFEEETTGELAEDATAAQVEAALEALSTIGSGNVSVTGDAGGPWTVEFIGALAETDVSLMTADSRRTFAYTYNLEGELTDYAGPGGNVEYAYDETHQLTGATGDRTESYAYDANGNRTDSHLHDDDYVTGANNRLLSDGDFDYTYDDEGNRLTKTDLTTGDVTTYTWDYRNRLTSVVVTNSSQVVIDQLLARVDDTGEIDWYQTDNLGSVRQIVDADGSILNEKDYDSFGNIISETNPSAGDRFAFTAREWEAAVDLYFYRARWYDPAAGRFASEDLIGFHSGDVNLYRYVTNRTLDSLDPSGSTRVDSGVKICKAYRKGDELFGWFSVHDFIVIDGIGYGFFEVDHNPIGDGDVRDDDLKTYPEIDPDDAQPGQWYSVCTPIIIDDECNDPAVFRQAIRDYIANRKNNPGAYCVGARDCTAFVEAARIYAENKSRKCLLCPSNIIDVLDIAFPRRENRKIDFRPKK